MIAFGAKKTHPPVKYGSVKALNSDQSNKHFLLSLEKEMTITRIGTTKMRIGAMRHPPYDSNISEPQPWNLCA